MTSSSSEEQGQRRDDILARLPITEQDQQRPWGPVSSRERWGEKGASSQKGLFSLPLGLGIRTVGVQSSMGVADRTKSPCWGQDHAPVTCTNLKCMDHHGLEMLTVAPKATCQNTQPFSVRPSKTMAALLDRDLLLKY